MGGIALTVLYVLGMGTLGFFLATVLYLALFMLVEMAGHVQLVARSTTDAVDVGDIATALGGGGHSRAAAALIREGNLHSVFETLVYLHEAEQAGLVKADRRAVQCGEWPGSCGRKTHSSSATASNPPQNTSTTSAQPRATAVSLRPCSYWRSRAGMKDALRRALADHPTLKRRLTVDIDPLTVL